MVNRNLLAVRIDKADVAAGHMPFVKCAVCHGLGVNSPGTTGPDLRESGIPLRLETLSQLLKSDALIGNGDAALRPP
jgi:cytochrome c2